MGSAIPLVEYKNQATTMFSGLLSDIRAGVIAQMFRARLVSSEELKKPPQHRKQAGGTRCGVG
jgi:preprotein translocase subunit SecA